MSVDACGSDADDAEISIAEPAHCRTPKAARVPMHRAYLTVERCARHRSLVSRGLGNGQTFPSSRRECGLNCTFWQIVVMISLFLLGKGKVDPPEFLAFLSPYVEGG